jgi:hypothetical protein
MCTKDHSIIAIATDEPLEAKVDIPQLDLNNPAEIANFIANQLNV